MEAVDEADAVLLEAHEGDPRALPDEDPRHQPPPEAVLQDERVVVVCPVVGDDGAVAVVPAEEPVAELHVAAVAVEAEALLEAGVVLVGLPLVDPQDVDLTWLGL